MEPKPIPLTPVIISAVLLLVLEWGNNILITSTGMNPLVGMGITRLVDIMVMLPVISTMGAGLSIIGLKFSELPNGLFRGFLWSIGFGVILGIGWLLIYLSGYDPFKFIHVNLPKQPGQLAVFYLVAGITAPIGEEIFFRGLIYGFFRRWGILPAILISTLFFGAAHTTTTAIPVTQLAGGFIFAVAYERERNLLVPILIHGLGNICIFTISLLYY